MVLPFVSALNSVKIFFKKFLVTLVHVYFINVLFRIFKAISVLLTSNFIPKLFYSLSISMLLNKI